MFLLLLTGGYNAISVYEIDSDGTTPVDPTPAPVPVVDPGSGDDYSFVGCSADSKGNRVRRGGVGVLIWPSLNAEETRRSVSCMCLDVLTVAGRYTCSIGSCPRR